MSGACRSPANRPSHGYVRRSPRRTGSPFRAAPRRGRRPCATRAPADRPSDAIRQHTSSPSPADRETPVPRSSTHCPQDAPGLRSWSPRRRNRCGCRPCPERHRAAAAERCRCRSSRWRTPPRTPCCRSCGPETPARGRTHGCPASPRRSRAGSSARSSACRASRPCPHRRFRSSGLRHRPAPPAARCHDSSPRPQPIAENSESWRACRSSRAARASVHGARSRSRKENQARPEHSFHIRRHCFSLWMKICQKYK